MPQHHISRAQAPTLARLFRFMGINIYFGCVVYRSPSGHTIGKGSKFGVLATKQVIKDSLPLVSSLYTCTSQPSRRFVIYTIPTRRYLSKVHRWRRADLICEYMLNTVPHVHTRSSSAGHAKSLSLLSILPPFGLTG